MSATSTHASGEVSTLIPARLERLPWGRFHVLVIAALGITWILDGLEVTLAGSVAAALKDKPGASFLGFRGRVGRQRLPSRRGVRRAVLRLADRPARAQEALLHHHRRLPIATALTGLAWNGFTFFLFRFFTGCGIGGEYSAINSTIQELIPARFRGHLDLMINGSFWVGAALGALVAVALLNPALVTSGVRMAARLPDRRGARPRRLRHAHVDSGKPALARDPRARGGGRGGRRGDREAVRDEGVELEPVPADAAIRLRSRDHTPLREVFDTLINRHRVRTFVGLTLMAAQAFFYNAIFFTYALVLTKFYAVSSAPSAGTSCPSRSAISLGRSLLGRLFDTLRTAADDLADLWRSPACS